MAENPMLKFVTVDRDMPEKRDAGERVVRISMRSIPNMLRKKPANRPAGAVSVGCLTVSRIVRCTTTFPDWLKLTAEGRLREAYDISAGDQHISRDLWPDLPAGSACAKAIA